MGLIQFIRESFSQFMIPSVIVIYLIVTPLIDLATDKDDITCFYNTSAQTLHSGLFCILVLMALIHVTLVAHGSMDEPWMQEDVRRTFKLKLNQERIGVLLGNFLEVVLVAFWAIFSGPEPLTCWILINPSEYSGFQGGRAALFVGIGLPLFVFISFCHHFGGNLQTVP